jgi:hypothetical protein
MVASPILEEYMIDRHSVIEYLNKHPTHSSRQIRLHFLQTVRQNLETAGLAVQRQQPVSLGSVVNQLNYILRDLEASGNIPPRLESANVANNHHRSEDSSN